MPFGTKSLINKGTHLTKMINPYVNLKTNDMSVYLVYKPKKAPAFATDSSGKHFAHTKTICSEQDCETKFCRSICGKVVKIINNGHFTHNPPPGTNAVLLDAQDFNGQTTKQGQHFIKSTTKPTLSAEELKDLTENDLEPNKNADVYSSLPHIFKKLK